MKAKLKELIKDKEIRKHFAEKMRIKLAEMWDNKQTGTESFKKLNTKYEMFLDKIADIEEEIFNITPSGINYNELKFKITDY